jgi:hypothetical protein
MTKGTSLSSSGARAALAVLLLVLGYLLVGYVTLSPSHDWGDDWAQYVNHARNLATGRAYSDTGYVFNPNEPHVGPPSYSPGLPLLLAPIIRFFGVNIIALKSVSLACMAAAIFFTFILFRGALGAWVAAGAAFLFGLHDFSWSMRDYIVSEPSYILWTLVSLYFASRPVRERGITSGLACGLFAYAAFATRPIGISLIIAAVLYEIAQRRFLSWRFLCIAGVPAAGIVLQKHFLTFADYSAELHVPTWHELGENIIGYWTAAGSLFPLGGKLSLLSPVAIAGLAALGIGYRLWPRDARARQGISGSRLSHLAERIPVDVWYLCVYCGALVALPFETNARYLFPLFPVIGAYVVYAVGRVLRATRYARPAGALVAGVCLGYYGTLHWVHDRTRPGEDALCNDCRAMYSFIQEHTGTGALVAFAKPRAMALLAGRSTWIWTAGQDQESNWSELVRAHTEYIVLVPPTHPLAGRYPPYLSWDTWRSNPHLTLVFENQTFRVLRLQQKDS